MLGNSTYINRTIYSFIFISVLWFMLKKKSENVRLRYCDGIDKYLHPTGVKHIETRLWKSLQQQQIRSSILKFSNRPVSILSDATPHLNLAVYVLLIFIIVQILCLRDETLIKYWIELKCVLCYHTGSKIINELGQQTIRSNVFNCFVI
jgi:hypothetical protein